MTFHIDIWGTNCYTSTGMNIKVWIAGLCLALGISALVTPVQATLYIQRGGELIEKPGTNVNPNPNIYIDDLIQTLLTQQRQLAELKRMIKNRDKQILELQNDMQRLRNEMNGLKRHYFRQF